MAQKILRTMQDDLKEAREKQQQQAGNDDSRKDDVRNGATAQIKNSLQQPTTNQKEPEAFETEQKTPVSGGFDSLNLSSLNPDRDGESESRISEIAETPDKNIPKNGLDASGEEEANRKAIEEQRKKIEEAQKRAEEQARLEDERLKAEEEKRKKEEAERKMKEDEERKAQEEQQRQIEEAIKKAEEEAFKKEEERRKAEEEARLEAERLKAEEERKAREEKARLQAEREREEKARIEEERKKETEEISEEEKEKRREEEEEKKEMEEKKQRIERERERIEELKKREEELEELKKRQEEITREEEIEKKIEAERKAREEEARRRAEELRRKEEEIKKAEEEAERKDEELAMQEEEEIRKTEEEARKIEEEAEKIEQELARKEEELQQMEKEEKERIAELMKKEEERTEAEEELERKEEELKEKEREREKREELRKKMRAEILGEEMPEEETENEERGDIIAEDYAAETDGEIIAKKKEEAAENEETTKDGETEEYAANPVSEEKTYEDDFSANPETNKAEQEESYTSKSDQELSSLIKRVSTAMDTTIKREDGAAPTPPITPDKDIKELIARMSKNLEQEREMLEKEHVKEAEEEIPQQNDEIPSQPDPIKTEDSPDIKDELEPTDDGAEPATAAEQPKETERPEESAPKEPATSVAAIPEMPVMRQTAAMAEAAAPQPEKPADSYWSELHDTLKNTAENPGAQAYPNAEETGLIVPKQAAKQEQNVPPQRQRASADDEYINPENRLIFGRQEFYSSMHKKVKPRTQQADLEEFKETVKEEEIKLSDEEEKKKLRHQIITKYKIQLFSMPWKKIIIFTVILLSTIGITLYTLIPRLAPKQEIAEEIPTGESIAEIDQLIPQKITARHKDISALNYFDSEIDPWKSLADKSITRLIVNYDEHEIMLPRDEALKTVLGEDSFKNMPQSVLKFLGNKYDILAFKNDDVLRLGIVFKYDRNQEDEFKESMAAWSNASTRAEKIHNVMKALFVNSKVEERSATTFQPSVYSNVDIYYLNLPDTDTSMDYFTYKGYLVFTTSKNTTSEMIDLLQK